MPPALAMLRDDRLDEFLPPSTSTSATMVPLHDDQAVGDAVRLAIEMAMMPSDPTTRDLFKDGPRYAQLETLAVERVRRYYALQQTNVSGQLLNQGDVGRLAQLVWIDHKRRDLDLWKTLLDNDLYQCSAPLWAWMDDVKADGTLQAALSRVAPRMRVQIDLDGMALTEPPGGGWVVVCRPSSLKRAVQWAALFRRKHATSPIDLLDRDSASAARTCILSVVNDDTVRSFAIQSCVVARRCRAPLSSGQGLWMALRAHCVECASWSRSEEEEAAIALEDVEEEDSALQEGEEDEYRHPTDRPTQAPYLWLGLVVPLVAVAAELPVNTVRRTRHVRRGLVTGNNWRMLTLLREWQRSHDGGREDDVERLREECPGSVCSPSPAATGTSTRTSWPSTGHGGRPRRSTLRACVFSDR